MSLAARRNGHTGGRRVRLAHSRKVFSEQDRGIFTQLEVIEGAGEGSLGVGRGLGCCQGVVKSDLGRDVGGRGGILFLELEGLNLQRR